MAKDLHNKKKNSRKDPEPSFGPLNLIGNQELMFPATDDFSMEDLENLDIEDMEYLT